MVPHVGEMGEMGWLPRRESFLKYPSVIIIVIEA